MSEETSSSKAPRERSPSFPFIPLKMAIDRLKEFEEKFGRSPPPANRVYLAWGFKGDTSQAQQTLAALKSFGLVSYEGSGPARLVVFSEDGRNYLRAQQESVKRDILRRIALNPSWIAKMWEKWGTTRHPDEVCLDQLVLEHKFNENGAPRFLTVYDQTIAYAELLNSDKATSDEDGETGGGKDEAPDVSIGDKIQCSVGGRDMFGSPATVLGLSEDGLWVFTDQSNAGIPLEDVTVIKHASNTPPDRTAPPIPDHFRTPSLSGQMGITPPAGTLEDKAHLDEGVAILRWPETLSAESVEELEYWINGILKRAKRRAGIANKGKAAEGE